MLKKEEEKSGPESEEEETTEEETDSEEEGDARLKPVFVRSDRLMFRPQASHEPVLTRYRYFWMVLFLFRPFDGQNKDNAI